MNFFIHSDQKHCCGIGLECILPKKMYGPGPITIIVKSVKT